MATKSMTGAGVTITIGGVNVGQLKSVAMGGVKWSTDDITNAASPAAGVGVLKEVLPSVLDSGECTVEGVWLYNDAGQVALQTAFAAGTLGAFVITLLKGEGQATAGASLTFSGFVTDPPFPDSISFDKVLLFKSVIKINTAITVSFGS